MPCDPGPQHLVPFSGGHLPPENLGRAYSGALELRDGVFLNDDEILELLIEVAGEQQHGVFQLAFATVQRPLAEIADHDRGPDHDRSNQQHPAQHQPTDRALRKRQFEIEQKVSVNLHSVLEPAPSGMFAMPTRTWIPLRNGSAVTKSG